jgi:hypothetical protein
LAETGSGARGDKIGFGEGSGERVMNESEAGEDKGEIDEHVLRRVAAGGQIDRIEAS